MSILKYKDPKTGEFKRINPYKADLSFVGKDGITVNKATDSEKVEISGSGCVQKDTRNTGLRRAYTVNESGIEQIMMPINVDAIKTNIYSLVRRDGNVSVHGLVPDSPTDTVLLNKKYVDANYVKKVEFTNLEQALNGYILDTTEEAYADLDSAVLKDSVAVGDNVYPIADKTRALVSRIEGKTTKMVQLLDKSTFPATLTPSPGVTVTKTDDGGLHVSGTAASSGGRNSWGITVNIKKGHKYLNLLKGNNKLTTPFVTLKSDRTQYLTIADIATSTIEGECSYGFNLATEDYDETIYPNLFDLTAMNREDITTVEQFKAEFPELYPYENGNIYPAKISGVKFTGKNLLDSNTNNLIFNNGNVEVVGNNIIATTNMTNARFCYKSIPLIIGETYTVSVSNYVKENSNALGVGVSYDDTADMVFGLLTETKKTLTFTATRSQLFIKMYITYEVNGEAKIIISNLQVETGNQATAYEPYTNPVSVTLPKTYDLHGIGDYKDYLEITKNENNELYTLKKVQVIDKHVFDGTENWGSYPRTDFTNIAYSFNLGANFKSWYKRGNLMNLLENIKTLMADKKGYSHGDASSNIFICLPNIANTAAMKAHVLAMYEAGTPYIFYGAIETPVETVIATNLTYEQVTAIRNNGGLIEVEGNTNKGYARPTAKNTVVYRLTATSTAEG